MGRAHFDVDQVERAREGAVQRGEAHLFSHSARESVSDGSRFPDPEREAEKIPADALLVVNERRLARLRQIRRTR